MTCGVLVFVHGRQIESFWEWKHNYTDGFPTKSRSTTGRFFPFINLLFDLTQLILPRNTYAHKEFAYASTEPYTTDRKQIKLGGKTPFQGNYETFEMQPILPVF